MSRGKASGYKLKSGDIPIIIGMVNRGDRDHDIAAWFGVNQGRIAEAKEGKHGTPSSVPSGQLPPKGPPGIKGRRLRIAVDKALSILSKGGPNSGGDVEKLLREEAQRYDAPET